MSDDTASPPSRSWIERLSALFEVEPKNRPDLIAVLRDAQQRGLINADSQSMLEGVLQVSELQVRDVMIPRPKMVVVEREQPVLDIIRTVVESTHSRLPVLGDSRDDIVGILLAKDLLHLYVDAVSKGDEIQRIAIREFLRPAVIVPESKRLDVLLKDFRAKRNHMAMVVDEYGSIVGLVTIEDVLEQIVGDIEDETDIDTEEDNILALSEREYHVKALTDILDFNHYFRTDYADDEVDTVGGLVLRAFGHLPGRGESVEIPPFLFTVMHADQRRIRQLKVEPVD